LLSYNTLIPEDDDEREVQPTFRFNAYFNVAVFFMFNLLRKRESNRRSKRCLGMGYFQRNKKVNGLPAEASWCGRIDVVNYVAHGYFLKRARRLLRHRSRDESGRHDNDTASKNFATILTKSQAGKNRPSCWARV